MQTTEDIVNEKSLLNDESDSDSDSSSSILPLPYGRRLLDLKKEYINRAEGRLSHITNTEKAITQVDNTHVNFIDLFKIDNKELTIDLEKIHRFRSIYNERDATCEKIIGKTKQISKHFAEDVAGSIERGNQKKLSQNLSQLRQILKEEAKIVRKKNSEELPKLIKLEEALNSYSIIPIEPAHNTIYQVGVLHCAKIKEIITPREFRVSMLIRINQLPDPFRWLEREEDIIDMTSDFDCLASQLNSYLKDESEAYRDACRRFEKRVKGIHYELKTTEKSIASALVQLDALSQTENSLSTMDEVTNRQSLDNKKSTLLFHRLLPEEMMTLTEVVDVKGSLYLGQSLEVLAHGYQKSIMEGEKKVLESNDYLKYVLKAQDTVTETVSHAHDNLMNGLSLASTVDGLFPKLKRIEEDYKKESNGVIPSNFTGTATEQLFTDYFLYLDTKLSILQKDLKKQVKKSDSKKIASCEAAIEKYRLIKNRAKTLETFVLNSEQGETIILGADVCVYEHGTSFKVISKFEEQLEGKNKNNLLQLKFELEKEVPANKEYAEIKQLHETERCLSGDKWKPLPEAFSSYLDKKIESFETQSESQNTLDDCAQLAAAIERDTHTYKKTKSIRFYQSLPEEKESLTTMQKVQEGAIGALTCLF